MDGQGNSERTDKAGNLKINGYGGSLQKIYSV